MVAQYRCQNQARRAAVRNPRAADGSPLPPVVNGIDFLEVSEDQLTLTVHFLHNLPGGGGPDPLPAAALTPENIAIEGGVRVTGIRVETIAANGNVLTVTVNAPGDFSTYTLRLVRSVIDDEPPDDFDPQLAAVEFSFKVDCPSEFDCGPDQECPPGQLEEPEIDYLAKDYASFRRLMLDRLSALMPEWRERNPADMQVALVEMLAYAGDHLSYFQDAVATEAYLGTARRRISVRRHARLLDYFLHDGCNARAWVSFEVGPPPDGDAAEGLEVPAGTRLLSRGVEGTPMLAPDSEPERRALAAGALVFETAEALTLRRTHNRISFYTWSDSECCLPRGSTRATLLDSSTEPLQLEAGQVLIFEEVRSPTTGAEADADPSLRHAVLLTRVTPKVDRLDGTPIVEIAWAGADALPFPVCVSALIRGPQGNLPVADVSVARGNVVLADHGRTYVDEPLLPPLAPEDAPYRPRLARVPLTYRGPIDRTSAAATMRRELRTVRPWVELLGDGLTWSPQYDLLSSDRFRPEFVVEMEADGVAHLRFGDGVLGRRPTEGAQFSATYRVGNGQVGNVGAEAITRVVLAGSGIARVRNPLAATGGTDPEPTEQARLFAPQAFRVQERAVTEADYAEVTGRHPEVQQAVATIRWTGSWYTVFVTVDRKGGLPVDADFEEELRAHLERYRIAGYDLEVSAPVFVPLDLLLRVCAKPGYFRSNVKRALLIALSSRALPGGGRGFFHPDNFTFAQPVYLSRIYQAAMAVPGVASVEVLRFQRWGQAPNQEIDSGVLKLGALEVARLDNDPNFPENGKLEIVVEGGL